MRQLACSAPVLAAIGWAGTLVRPGARVWARGAAALYLVLVLMTPLDIRATVTSLAVFPVALATIGGNWRSGLALAAALTGVNVVLLPLPTFASLGSLIGHAVLFGIALGTAWLRQMQLRLSEQAHTITALQQVDAARATRAELVAGTLAHIGGAPDLTAALEALLRGASRLLETNHSLARTFDPDTGERDFELVLDLQGQLEHRPRPGPLPLASFGMQLWQGRGPVVVTNYGGVDPVVPSGYAYAEEVQRDGLRSAIHVPITADGRVIGNLSLNHCRPGAFGSHEMALAAALATLAGAAIQRARLAEARAESEAERQRLDGALLVARTVAHEINNALAPAIGYAELLTQQPPPPAKQAAQWAELVLQSCELAAGKVQRLQRIARLEETRSSPLDAATLLDLERSTAPA